MGRSKCQNYDKKYLSVAKKSVLQNKLTIPKALECFGIPYTTLYRAVTAKSLKNYGGQCVLKEEDENHLEECLKICGEWGFPLSQKDITNIVQEYKLPSKSWSFG